MQPKHPAVLCCHEHLVVMQEKIRLRQWQQLDQATSLFSSAMVVLQDVLENESHPIAQQELIDLSLQQRRISRTLHNAMLSNRNELQEVNQGIRHLKQRKSLLTTHENAQ